MITGIEIRRRVPFVGGARFGETGAYERIEGTASGTLDPAHRRNRAIALLDQAPRDADGRVAYCTDFILLRPADPDRGNGRLLYEVNNRGRIMLFANLCAGTSGNDPAEASALGNALPLRLGFTLLWSGWDPGAPGATGLSLQVPAIAGLTLPVREEFVSGTRLGRHDVFRLAHAATGPVTATVRRTRTAAPVEVPVRCLDAHTVCLEPEGTLPETGSIYEIRTAASDPPVLGVGFAATSDLVSHLRHRGAGLVGRTISHTIGFGISQAGRYLRDHIALGFNADENGRRVFDGVYTHVAGSGRVFHNAPFAQPFRTRSRHEDHDFPEIEFPFSSAWLHDPVTGRTGALMRGDESDPKLIETNTSTEYWQKGASLLHTDPLGRRDVMLPPNVRCYLIAGTQHAGKAGMPRDNGPCLYPRNWHDPMPAVRALLVALDAWITRDIPPPESRLPRIADGTLVPAADLGFPDIPGCKRPSAANDVAPLGDWTDPADPTHLYGALVSQVDADGNERAGIILPEVAVPLGTFTGWNLYAHPYPEDELADRDGAFLCFASTRQDRLLSGDPRPSLAERYTAGQREHGLAEVAEALVSERLLLAEDAALYRAAVGAEPSAVGSTGGSE